MTRVITPLRSKLPQVGTTIFTVMSRLANELGAINLSQGFPDFDCDPALVARVHEYMMRGQNQYAPMQGVSGLREALAAKYRDSYGVEYDPETEVTITSGGTEALFDAITAVVQSGDEVLVFEPCYDSYVPAIQLNGGRPTFVTLSPPDYRIDWTEVRRLISPHTRLIILNSPHNPTGTVLGAEDRRELAAIVDETDILILSDEVYEHIIFDGLRHESMAWIPTLRTRSFIVGSFGKTYHTTGWKIGYCMAPAALTSELRRVHQYVTFASNTPIQHALAEFVRDRVGFPELPAFYQAKRDRFLELLEGSRFRPIPCSGTYFQLLDYSNISAEDDMSLAVRLTKEHGVASIPTSPFLYQAPAPRVLRFCFAKKDDTLERAAERLRRV